MTSPRLAIVALHGVGSASRGYSHHMERRVVTDLEARSWSPGSVVWREVLWGAGLAQAQARYLAAIGGGPLTRVVVEMAGDALALIGAAGDAVRDQVRDALALAAVEAQMIAVVAHSMGGILAWQALGSPEVAARCGAVCLLGSPLAAAMMGGARSATLPELGEARSAAPWLAIRDEADALGLPLGRSGARDVVVDVGGAPWRDATPLAHTGYWSSRQVAVRVATHLDALRR